MLFDLIFTWISWTVSNIYSVLLVQIEVRGPDSILQILAIEALRQEQKITKHLSCELNRYKLQLYSPQLLQK